ncbi:MAG TPA: hypothetical protein PLI14_06565 [Bacilli bacterium]|mgnify:CR=1 FL=1|nr:hypothetical protein [Bacilli bacterium]
MEVKKIAKEMNKALKLVPEIFLDNEKSMQQEIEEVCQELKPEDLSALSKATVATLMKQEFFPEVLLEAACKRIGKKMSKDLKKEPEKTTKSVAKSKGGTGNKAGKESKTEAETQPKSSAKPTKKAAKKDEAKPKAEKKQRKETNLNTARRMFKEGFSLEEFSSELEQSYKEKGKDQKKEWYANRAAIYWNIAAKEVEA